MLIHQSYFNTTQAAEYISLSRQFLEAARVKGGGPVYIKLGRAVRYARADLDAWMTAHRRDHTAQRNSNLQSAG